ncbi:MAG: amidase domain-containing protein [Clostridia bacterium]|nr:amidase domain-containing protein [Clostridia bacterium]
MLVVAEYNRMRALEYARRWAMARNPLFYNFTGIGGDCTNFVSQSVLAGSCVMNFTPDFGWYYRTSEDRAPAWTGVEYFWEFMTGAGEFRAANGGTGPFGRAVSEGEVAEGDVVQLGDAEGDYYHTLLITGRGAQGLLVSAHSNDAYNRPLARYDAPLKRFLHIEGVRFDVQRADCFGNLINGIALPVT